MSATTPDLMPYSMSDRGNLPRALLGLLMVAATLGALTFGLFFLRDAQAGTGAHLSPVIIVVLAIIWGVGGVALLFTTANYFVSQLAAVWSRRLQPLIFVGPALLMLTWALVLPTFRTFYYSLFDANSVKFVGLQNYVKVFADPATLEVFRNNLLWMVFGTSFTVAIGLLIAVLADRSRFETIAKSLIFLPMAISFVGAGVIWNFVYAVRPAGEPQIGLLNAIWVALGRAPVAWTAFSPPWNNFFLIVIVIWLQVGYSMVLFSAAIKGIPEEILEAARIDGANETQIFFQIMIPLIRATIITVSTTVVVFSLKIFDVVWIMTGGEYSTGVIATEFYRQYFTYNSNGIGSALAMILLICVAPVMAYNLRQFARREVF